MDKEEEKKETVKKPAEESEKEEKSRPSESEEKPNDFGGLPDRDLKKNLGCG